MEVRCTFESNTEALRAIWSRGVALFESISPKDITSSPTPYGFLTYLRAYLYLIGDREGARSLLQSAYRSFLASEDIEKLYIFPVALEYYDVYADDPLFTGDILGQFLKDCRRFTPPAGLFHHFAYDALFLGAYFSICRLHAKTGLCVDVSHRVELIERFHSAYFDEKIGQYHDENGALTPLTQILPVSFGFLREESRSATRRWLIQESFSVPRELRTLLYDALLSEELSDLIMPTLLEGGLPGAGQIPDDLSGILCILSHLCGIDLGMLGRGIQASTPHVPQGVSYSLIIPAPHTYLYFESEDYPGELVL